MSRCDYINVPCDFCGKDIPRARLQEHLSQCDQRSERCKDCGESVKISTLRVSSENFSTIFGSILYLNLQCYEKLFWLVINGFNV